jgi:putative transposase
LLFAFVIMPDHIHLILKVNAPLTISSFVKRLKTHVAHVLANGPMWEHSFWSETIDSMHLFHQKLIYTHENPVRAGLVQVAEEYPWSSAQEYLCKPEVELVDWPY